MIANVNQAEFQNDIHFSIQFVSKITGINAHTIRAWEKRYNAVTPLRDHNGRRVYSQNEVDRLNLLSNLVQEGHAISEVAARETLELQDILGKFPHTQTENPFEVKEKFNFEEALQNIFLGITFSKLDVVYHELNKAKNAISEREFILEIIIPIQKKLESLKMKEEEYASYIFLLKEVASSLLHEKKAKREDEKTTLILYSKNINDELEALKKALLLKFYGQESMLMNFDMPIESVCKFLSQLSMKSIILEAKHINKEVLQSYVQDLREKQEQLKIYISRSQNRSVALFGQSVHFIDEAQDLENLSIANKFKVY